MKISETAAALQKKNDEELFDTLIAISVIAKMMAKRIHVKLEKGEEEDGEDE